jgi:hypothetical protein
VTDRLTLEADNGEQVSLTLFGRIKKPFRFIDPDNPANSARARLCVSGDQFIVEFSAYDPNLNLSRANYQFLDASGRNVGNSIDVDIQQAIAGRNILKGQSVTVSQRFSGAGDNRRSRGLMPGPVSLRRAVVRCSTAAPRPGGRAGPDAKSAGFS